MAFNLPVQNFFTKTIGPSDWVRPVDWPSIVDTSNEVQFLMSDLADSNCGIVTSFSRTSGSQNLIIDWGDSTFDIITTTTQTTTTHTYTSGGTPCSLGYNTFKIRVYFSGVGASTLSDCQIRALQISGNTTGLGFKIVGVLEAYYGDGTQTTVPSFYSNVAATNSVSSYRFLNYVKLPSSVSWSSFANMFSNCYSLYEVVMPLSASSATSFVGAFSNCFKLQEINLPSNATGITTFNQTFNVCQNLKKVSFPTSLNSCTTFANAFTSCANLKNITLPSINSCTSFNNTFTNCFQLEWVKFNSLPTTAVAIDFTSAFSTNSNLQNVYFPSSCNSGSTYNFAGCFTSCSQLKIIVLPSNMNVSSFSTAFNGCSLLAEITFPTTCSSLTTMASMCLNNFSLKTITLPTTVGSNISLNACFSGCYKLESISIPSGYTFSNLGSTFSSCYSLKEVNWNPGAQNSLTTMASTFSECRLLESVSIPTSMSTNTTLSSCFLNCYNLVSIGGFPSSLNAITTMSSTFSGCYSLSGVTLPTSMSVCTIFSSAFANCGSIKSVTLPNVVSTVTTAFDSCFNGCTNLQSVTFPGANQLSLVNTINSLFLGCSNLTTITNFNKIGSLSTTPLINAASITQNRLTSISFVGPLSILNLNGTASNQRADVQSVRLLNTSSGQWTGTSPQINVSQTNMSTAQLVQLFNDMAAQGNVVSKTINITTAVGAAGLSTSDRLIVTSKGWTITG